MNEPIRYDPTAAHALLKDKHLKNIEAEAAVARQTVFDDVALLDSGAKISKEKRPLDAGFVELPRRLLDERASNPKSSLLTRIERIAALLREQIDVLVSLGVGGSYMGARAIFEALCHPYHNELTRDRRGGAPRLYFEGNNIDNDALRGLLELLGTACTDPHNTAHRWGITVISKSGGTLETAVAFRIFRQALEQFYGRDARECRELVVPITGRKGKLRDLCATEGYEHALPIPDNVGGRFSVLTSVALFPAAVLGLDVARLLEGAADMTERLRDAPFGSNPALDYAATCSLLEEKQNMTIRVLATWGNRLEGLGLWYDQLLSESLGKDELGATPITTVNTRDLHSRGQQHQEGARDKLITNVVVEEPSTEPLAVPSVDQTRDKDDLNKLAGKTVPDLLAAAIRGTAKAYADDKRPTADILLPRLNEYTLGQLFQMLMLATVVEGRLIDINPYGQPGVESYKQNMTKILAAS